MKVCVSYSDTHELFLYDFFIESFPFEPGISLTIEKLPQRCSTGALFSDGWREQMMEKQIFINKQLKSSVDGEIFLFCDVDIRFYGKIYNDLKENLKDCDICFMKDHNSDTVGRCGGFFAVKSSSKIKKFFQEIYKKLEALQGPVSFESSEQSAINTLLNERKNIVWKYLPERYYTHGLYTKGIKNFSESNQSGLWWENKDLDEKRDVFMPTDMLVHHANWCNGISNKIELLRFIKSKMDFRNRRHKNLTAGEAPATKRKR